MSRIQPRRLVESPGRGLLLSIAAILVATAPGVVGAEGTLRAGAAASVITPPLGTSINGGMSDRKSDDVHDELHARCLVLDDGSKKLAFVVCDLCMIPREIVVEAKRLITAEQGIPAQNVTISATHSHSTPTCAPVFQSDTVPGYPSFLARRIADGVTRSVKRLEPARAGWGVAKNDRQVFNRRWYLKPEGDTSNPFGGKDKVRMNPAVGSVELLEPAGPIDPDVSVLAVEAKDGRSIALFANYSLHYVGGVPGNTISADYYGVFAREVARLLNADESETETPFVGIMSNGTSGDINNINFRGGQPAMPLYGKMREVARDLAIDAVRAASLAEMHDDLTLDSQATELSLGVRKPTAEELARAKAIVEKAGSRPMQTLEEIYARESVLMSQYPDTVPVTIQAFRVGELGVVQIPCETFVEIGLEIKRESPLKPTFTISLANGYNGYLPTPKHHELGGYETWRAQSSYLEVNASEKITEAALGLLKELKAAAP